MPGDSGSGVWVVGVDGSANAEHALAWAANHAKGRASCLRLVGAWQTPLLGPAVETWPIGSSTYDRDSLMESTQRLVDDAAATARPLTDVALQATIAHGGAATALLDATDEASLLVVGTRGRGGFRRLLLGSTSTQCATHVSRPIAVIPEQSDVTETRDILVGVDGSPNSIAALRWALTFATSKTRVEALSVWDTSPLAAGADQFFFPEATGLAEERFHHIVDGVESAVAQNRTIERTFVTGMPRQTIAEQAETTDLLVVGTRGHGAL
ncbi:MAG: universal stress protein, partial [Ilumatobacter sp.]|nr:universal stress protein [Ilumatobacter sp.]